MFQLNPWVLSVLACLLLATPLLAQYQDLPDIYDTMRALTNGTSSDVACFRLTDSTGAVTWTEGTPYSTNLLCLRVAKGGIGTGRKKILVIGNQHAREWIANRCVLDCAQFVISNRNSTVWPQEWRFTNYLAKFKGMNISNLTDNANIYFIPVVNPTGYAYSYANDTNVTTGWRKNRRATTGDADPGAGRYSTYDSIEPGVDLNRNWPSTDWAEDGERIWFPGPDKQIRTSRYRMDEVYCGKPVGNSWTNTPFRPPICEKEVEAVVTLINSNTFDVIIDMHSWGRQVGWAENVATNSIHIRANQGWSNDQQVVQLLAAKAASLIKDPDSGDLYTPKSPYPVSGDSLWYQYEKSGSNSLAFLIEVGPDYNFRPNNATAHSDAVMPGMLFMMFSAVDKSFSAKPTFRFRKP